jgi:hypothetical protein
MKWMKHPTVRSVRKNNSIHVVYVKYSNACFGPNLCEGHPKWSYKCKNFKAMWIQPVSWAVEPTAFSLYVNVSEKHTDSIARAQQPPRPPFMKLQKFCCFTPFWKAPNNPVRLVLTASTLSSYSQNQQFVQYEHISRFEAKRQGVGVLTTKYTRRLITYTTIKIVTFKISGAAGDSQKNQLVKSSINVNDDEKYFIINNPYLVPIQNYFWN